MVLVAYLFINLAEPLRISALTASDLHSILSGTAYYDPGGSQSCETRSVTAGSGAANGSQFPNLNPQAMAGAINTWIKKENPNSQLSGLGDTIVASAKDSNVSPFLIVAIAAEESSLSDPSDFNVSHGNNSFGRAAIESQPHFQGARLWYKWSSVKASVDSTAPENKGAAGGGDMATYIRTQYPQQIDGGSFLDFFMKYAPPSENNTQDYATKVNSWVDDLVQLSGQSTSEASPAEGCGGGAFAGDVVKTATGLAWPSGSHGPNRSDATTAYQTALPQYNKLTSDYSDCGGFVATVMHASGSDTKYTDVYVPNQYTYVSKTAASQYKIIRSVKDTSQLQPGDILMYINPSNQGDSHTFIYVGHQPDFNGDGAAASLSGHVPEAVSTAGSFAYDGRAASGNYFAVRLIQ